MVKFEELNEEGQVAAAAGELAMLFTILVYLFPYMICESVARQVFTSLWHEVVVIALAFALMIIIFLTYKRLRVWLFSRTYKMALQFFKKENRQA